MKRMHAAKNTHSLTTSSTTRTLVPSFSLSLCSVYLYARNEISTLTNKFHLYFCTWRLEREGMRIGRSSAGPNLFYFIGINTKTGLGLLSSRFLRAKHTHFPGAGENKIEIETRLLFCWAWTTRLQHSFCLLHTPMHIHHSE